MTLLKVKIFHIIQNFIKKLYQIFILSSIQSLQYIQYYSLNIYKLERK